MTVETADAVPEGTKRIYLSSYEGMTHRLVSTNPPRDCTPDEIPIIDLTGIHGDLDARQSVAREILHAAKTSGFFYIKNHGIPDHITEAAHQKGKEYVWSLNSLIGIQVPIHQCPICCAASCSVVISHFVFSCFLPLCCVPLPPPFLLFFCLSVCS